MIEGMSPRAAHRLVALLTTVGTIFGIAQSGSCTPFTAEALSGADAEAEGGSPEGGAGTTPYVQAVAEDRPLAHWRLGEQAGGVAHAFVGGTAFDGAILGTPALGTAGAVKGDADTSLGFTANNGQAVDVGSTFDFVQTSPFSLEAWVNLSAVDGAYRHLFTKDTVAPIALREQYGIFVRLDATPSLVFERFVGGGKNAATYASPAATPLTLNQWHHVVGTYNGNLIALYLDGVSVASAVDTRQQQHKDGHFIIGAKTANDGTLLGAIDEVAVYDRALSEERVKRHYDAATTGR